MSEVIVDARGLSCPEPAMMARQALLKAEKGTVVVLVDSITSRDNVGRTGRMVGWQAAIEDQADGSFKIAFTK